MKELKPEHIANCLQGGGVVLLPTDTVYGLAVIPNDEDAISELFALKARPQNVNLPIMVASKTDLEKLNLKFEPSSLKLLHSHYMPGALTLVMGFASDERLPWLEGRDEIAIRIPNDKRLLQVLEITGPLLVTSANRHGNPTATAVEEILADLDGEPDLVVDGGKVEIVPSTIINCRTKPPTIEREGKIPGTELFDFLKKHL